MYQIGQADKIKLVSAQTSTRGACELALGSALTSASDHHVLGSGRRASINRLHVLREQTQVEKQKNKNPAAAVIEAVAKAKEEKS